MDVKELYEQAVRLATDVVNKVEDTDYDQPTPDTEWTVRDLLNHMLYELAWAADILHGKTVAEVGDAYDGNLIGDDLQAEWQRYAEAALSALDDIELTDTIHLSFGDFSAEYYLWQNGNDLAIHAWDLGEGIGEEVVFAQPLAEALYNYALERADELAASDLFGDPIEVPDSADTQTKLLGLYGRQR